MDLSEHNSELPEENSPKATGCVTCGHPIIEHGHATALCADCRRKFINYPIPRNIKIFGGAIVLLLVFAMVKAPSNFSTGVHYERGKKAMERKNYLTAQKELTKVVEKVPGFASANEYLVLSSFYNQDVATFLKIRKEMEGKSVEDQTIFAEINEASDKIINYIPLDSFMVLFETYHSFDSIPESAYKQHIATYPDEIYPMMRYASNLYDKEQYHSCDSLVDRILAKDNTYISALSLKPALKREFNQLDSAHYYCDRLISLNNESTYGISTKARMYLRQKKDTEALEWALKSLKVDANDPFSKTTLVLAYHFNNMIAERDKLLQAAKNDSTLTEYMKYAIDVIQGKEKFRTN